MGSAPFAKKTRNPLVFSLDVAAGDGGKSARFHRYHDTARVAFTLAQLGRVQ